MNQSFRRAAVGIPGFCAFFNLYGPQSLLPSLAREFDASPAQISLTVTATTLAIAISAPFAGTVADVLGRKRVIAAAMVVATIPLIMIALAPSLHALVFWRFVLGLALPPIFTVVVVSFTRKPVIGTAPPLTKRIPAALRVTVVAFL